MKSTSTRTINVREISKLPVLVENAAEELALFDRPKTREDCLTGNNARRPCPFVSCRHHLYLDVNEDSGSILFNHPEKEPHQMPHSCSLDVADKGEATLETVGNMLSLTRERVRQIACRAMRKVRDDGLDRDFLEHIQNRVDPMTPQDMLGSGISGVGGRGGGPSKKEKDEMIAACKKAIEEMGPKAKVLLRGLYHRPKRRVSLWNGGPFGPAAEPIPQGNRSLLVRGKFLAYQILQRLGVR